MKAKHVPMPYLTKCYNFILDEGAAVPRHTPQVDVVCDLDLAEQGRRHWLQHHARHLQQRNQNRFRVSVFLKSGSLGRGSFFDWRGQSIALHCTAGAAAALPLGCLVGWLVV